MKLISRELVLEKTVEKIQGNTQSIVDRFGNPDPKIATHAAENGLTHMGFNRFGLKDKITHIVVNKRLVPVDKNVDPEMGVEQSIKDYSKKLKAPEYKVPEKLHPIAADNTKLALINHHLDSKKPEENFGRQMQVVSLDKTFGRNMKTHTVYTGVSGDIDKGIYHTKGYRVVSPNLDKVRRASKHVLELQLKTGHKALPIGKDEMLLPRDHKIRIASNPLVTTQNKIWKAEYIPGLK